MFAQYITKDDFQFQMLTTVTSSTSQLNRLGSKWSRHLAEQADVDPSLAAVADYLVFGQAQHGHRHRHGHGPRGARASQSDRRQLSSTPQDTQNAKEGIHSHSGSQNIQNSATNIDATVGDVINADEEVEKVSFFDRCRLNI